MKFVKGNKTAAVHAIAKTICDGLAAGKRVLWLVSGGSNIALEVEVMTMLRDHAGNALSHLAVMPVDERYGKPGHKDSNMEQLREAGFAAGGATLVDVLIHDMSLEETVSFYTEVLSAALSNAGLVVGQLGMGADGHVAGIKPRSPGVEPDESTVAGYEYTDFKRLTLMPAALRQIDKAYLVAYGEDKKAALTRLQKGKAPVKDLPAMILYELPDVTVYNDYVSGSRGSKTKGDTV